MMLATPIMSNSWNTLNSFGGKYIVRKYTTWLFTDGNLTELGQIYFLKQRLEFHEKLQKIASSTTLKEQRIL